MLTCLYIFPESFSLSDLPFSLSDLPFRASPVSLHAYAKTNEYTNLASTTFASAALTKSRNLFLGSSFFPASFMGFYSDFCG